MPKSKLRPGATLRVRWDEDLGPVAGQRVELMGHPNQDGMVKVQLVVETWVSVDDLIED